MKELIQTICSHLVENPGEIRVAEVLGEKTLVYELRCNGSDVGKLIGKNGRTVAAIRTVLNTAASRTGKRVLLEVVQ